jgi:hypothetical protein
MYKKKNLNQKCVSEINLLYIKLHDLNQILRFSVGEIIFKFERCYAFKRGSTRILGHLM